jgi:hypothetical protein
MSNKPTPTEQPTTETVAVDPNTPVRLFCKRHGEITDAALNLTFSGPDGKKGQFLYCLHCLNEVLLSLQKAGSIEQVQIYVPGAEAAPAEEPVDPAVAALAALAAQTKPAAN